jgi:uncharacterized protein (TIRG00374 family)
MQLRIFSRTSLLVLGGWLLIGVLLWWTWRNIEWRALAATLSQLSIAELATLTLINAGIIILMSGRWWWILRVFGYPLSILTLARYRLTAFGINYFTPGPQFGGEPYQVYVLHKHQGIPLETSASSVAFDKLIELLANFGFLVFGFWTIIQFGLVGAFQGFLLYSLTAVVIGVLGLYLYSLFLKKYWARWMVERMGGLSVKSPFWRGVFQTIAAAEKQASEAINAHPGLFIITLGLSLFTWMVLVFEYRLALVYLGADLTLPQTIGVLTAARLAFLFPFPGGLGSLEFSQVFAMQALGAGTALGISMGLMIRARDLLFGGVGLFISGVPFAFLFKNKDRPLPPDGSDERMGQQDSSEEIVEVPHLEAHKKTA